MLKGVNHMWTRVGAVLMSNVLDVIPVVHLSTVVYRKYIYSRSASSTSLLHLTVHARCTCPLVA